MSTEQAFFVRERDVKALTATQTLTVQIRRPIGRADPQAATRHRKKLRMITTQSAALVSILTLALAACANQNGNPVSSTPPVSQKEISFTVGPCFGFCPVYSVSVKADATVAFEGKRHTAHLGQRNLTADRTAFAKLEAELAPFRPATGSTDRTKCDVEASDMSDYHIVWTDPDGSKTVLDHSLGCRSAANDQLNAVLRQAPDRLGISS